MVYTLIYIIIMDTQLEQSKQTELKLKNRIIEVILSNIQAIKITLVLESTCELVWSKVQIGGTG